MIGTIVFWLIIVVVLFFIGYRFLPLLLSKYNNMRMGNIEQELNSKRKELVEQLKFVKLKKELDEVNRNLQELKGGLI